MTFRKVKQYSDRGKIKDLASRQESEAKDSPSEQRIRRLYEYAKLHHDDGILNALGFITTEYIEDKTALPLTIYRIKKIIADITSRSGENIQRIKNELAGCFGPPIGIAAFAYIHKKQLIKTADRRPPVFRRVS